MSQFSILNKHINDILLQLVKNQNICKYLYYNTDKTTDPLTLQDISEEERLGLLYTLIFPFPKIPSDEEVKVGTYLNVYFKRISHPSSPYYKTSALIFDVICHIDKWQMKDQLRPYSVIDELYTHFHNKKTVGMGKTEFDSTELIRLNKDVVGYSAMFLISDISIN